MLEGVCLASRLWYLSVSHLSLSCIFLSASSASGLSGTFLCISLISRFSSLVSLMYHCSFLLSLFSFSSLLFISPVLSLSFRLSCLSQSVVVTLVTLSSASIISYHFPSRRL